MDTHAFDRGTVPARRIAILVASAALIATSLPGAGAAVAVDPCSTSPRLGGTFVQPALIDGWSNAQLDSEFGHLADACIDTQVLQWTADSGAQTAIYDTELPGFTQNTSTDVVDRLLAGAEASDASVIVTPGRQPRCVASPRRRRDGASAGP